MEEQIQSQSDVHEEGQVLYYNTPRKVDLFPVTTMIASMQSAGFNLK